MKCTTCKKTIIKEKYFPFCCERCQLLDLYSWFSEEYCIVEDLPEIIWDENPEKFWRNDD